MVATSGARLISDEAKDALVAHLFPLAAVVTPNQPEAAALCGFPLEGEGDVERAAQAIARLGGGKAAVLVKGGHGAHADDLLRLPDGTTTWLRGERIETANTHGTGCTLSSAIACGLARGLPLTEAVRAANVKTLVWL